MPTGMVIMPPANPVIALRVKAKKNTVVKIIRSRGIGITKVHFNTFVGSAKQLWYKHGVLTIPNVFYFVLTGMLCLNK